jgi:Flp pilus assembly protein CpaB
VAGVLLFVFVQQYRNSVNSKAQLVPVFVASSFIPHGTPAALVASQHLLQRTAVKKTQVLPGAITDPSQITGLVTATDIAPGQQIVLTSFAAGNPSLSSYLTGTARAVAIPVGAIQGLSGYITAGDHVDLIKSVGNNETVLAQNVVVLAVGGSELVVRATDRLAMTLASVADGAKYWVFLRPPVGAQQSVGVGTSVTG